MTHNKAVNTENLKPFKKGDDPRRDKGGNKNKEAQAFSILFRNALAKKMKPEELADIIITEAKRRRPWAIDIILERLMGKVAQPISGDLSLTYLVSEKFLPNGKDKKP